MVKGYSISISVSREVIIYIGIVKSVVIFTDFVSFQIDLQLCHIGYRESSEFLFNFQIAEIFGCHFLASYVYLEGLNTSES